MDRRAAALSAAALLLVGIGVVYAEDGPAIVLAPANELVCRYEKPTGSHMRVKICRTRAQIQAEAEATRRAMDAVKTRGHEGNVDPANSG